MNSVGDLQALHPIGVSPLLEVHLEGSSPPVAKITTNLALVLNSQPVQLIKPVRNGFSIPT